jgi:hypothetical protein
MGRRSSANDGPGGHLHGPDAALNHIHGGEVSVNGRYLTLPGHVAISNGFEVIVAKRPAVRHFPAPTQRSGDSGMTWRTDVPQLRIGSPTFGDDCPP